MRKFKKLFGICLMMLSFQVTLSEDRTIETSLGVGNVSLLDFFHQTKVTKLDRNSKSPTDQSILSQFNHYCTGNEPCTCYYPDHPNVTIFELSTDAETHIASGKNGKGPENCKDLRHLGYTLIGFYMVRFDSKRVKTIYCEFSKAKQTENNKTKVIKRSLKDMNIKTPKAKKLRFCGGVGHAPCIFYFSDNPDAPLVSRQSKNSTNNNNNEIGPKSCEDLEKIGHFVKGFYMVRLNSIKVKTVYCEFNKRILKNDKSNMKNIRPTVAKNATGATSKAARFCQGVGSQPCSCYTTNYTNILQFELSSDEITRNASRENGVGPKNCQDLKELGHILSGFYVVRYKVNIMKTVFCKFGEKDKDLKPARRPTKAKHVNRIKELFPVTVLPETTQREGQEEEKLTKLVTKTLSTTVKPTPNLEIPGFNFLGKFTKPIKTSSCGKNCVSYDFEPINTSKDGDVEKTELSRKPGKQIGKQNEQLDVDDLINQLLKLLPPDNILNPLDREIIQSKQRKGKKRRNTFGDTVRSHQ